MRRVQNSVRIVGELLGSSRSVKERTSAGRQQRQISQQHRLTILFPRFHGQIGGGDNER